MSGRPARLALAAVAALLSCGPFAQADQRFESDLKKAFSVCRALTEQAEKVACYDKLADKLTPPTFQGRLTLQTELFELDRPTRIRFESDGVIFVMYLKDERGGVVQNLHIGGGGEDSYVVETPGKYSLHINGAEGWRVWLEPLP